MRVDEVISVIATLSKAVMYLDSLVVKMLDKPGDAMRTTPDSIFRHVTTSIVLPCALVMTVSHDDPGWRDAMSAVDWPWRKEVVSGPDSLSRVQ